MKATISLLAAVLTGASAVDWSLTGYTSDDCDSTTAVYENGSDGVNFTCYSIGETVNSVNWNGNDFWCLYLYAGLECQDETKYLETGVAGCQAGDWGSYSFAIPSHGFPC